MEMISKLHMSRSKKQKLEAKAQAAAVAEAAGVAVESHASRSTRMRRTVTHTSLNRIPQQTACQHLQHPRRLNRITTTPQASSVRRSSSRRSSGSSVGKQSPVQTLVLVPAQQLRLHKLIMMLTTGSSQPRSKKGMQSRLRNNAPHLQPAQR